MTPLMFNREDVVQSKSILVRLLRLVFYKLRMTHDDFVHKHAEYCQRWGIPPEKSNHDRNNLRRALNEPEKITINTFQHAVVNILHLDIVRISVTIRDPKTGEERTIHSDDTTNEDIQESPS